MHALHRGNDVRLLRQEDRVGPLQEARSDQVTKLQKWSDTATIGVWNLLVNHVKMLPFENVFRRMDDQGKALKDLSLGAR